MIGFDTFVTRELTETLLQAVRCPSRVRRRWCVALKTRLECVAWLLYCRLLEATIWLMQALIRLSERRLFCISNAAHQALRVQRWLCPVQSICGQEFEDELFEATPTLHSDALNA